MNPFEQIQYDKLSDDIMLLGINTILRFNVVLSVKSKKDGRRIHFHQEYQYTSEKYTDIKELVTLRRQFDYYLSIENLRINENGNKEYIQIRARDMLYVLNQLEKVFIWFRSNKYKDLFAFNKNQEIIITKRIDPVYIQLLMNKYIQIEPIVVKYTSGDKIGIRMFLSSENNFIDIDIDKFMEFYYFMTTFNMYQSAQLLINYLQRPEYGTNRFDCDTLNTSLMTKINQEGYSETKANNRVIDKNKKQKSFFDKIDELK